MSFLVSQMFPGTLMLIDDHINLLGDNPLVGANDAELGPRFPDMSNVYDAGLRELARTVAAERRVPLREGVSVVGGLQANQHIPFRHETARHEALAELDDAPSDLRVERDVACRLDRARRDDARTKRSPLWPRHVHEHRRLLARPFPLRGGLGREDERGQARSDGRDDHAGDDGHLPARAPLVRLASPFQRGIVVLEQLVTHSSTSIEGVTERTQLPPSARHSEIR